MLGYLVALNCNVLGSKCAGMLYAAKRGHLALVQWWLDVGGDPEVVVQPSRRAKLVDSVRRWWRKHMLEIDETDPDAEWDEMSDVSIDTHTEAEPTPEVHAGGPVRGTAIATRLNPAGTPPSTLMASPERRAQSVRLASRADDLEAGLPDIDPGFDEQLLNRSGSLKMVVLGQSRADEPVLMALLAATPPSVWDRHQPAILRGVAEMGSVDCMRVCVRRGADINAWQGIVLSTAVYSGNIPLLRYLLAETGAETRHFGRTPMALVVALIAVESLAVLLYGLLLLIWVVSIVSLTFPENAIAAAFSLGAGIGVPELSIMAGLATLALGCMYRLVPLHGVARATAIITATKVERHHRAVERQRQNPPEAGEAGPAAGGEGARHHAADPATATRRLPMV
ncbi:hypothetical protein CAUPRSCDRAFT_10245 [Caulochytrium protostelioides]|uniref:Ankyrin n=1 Tax=Caulochytrium protostelioides TaxID=1555241 RepID=A0A4P9WXD9_9FUNG|nr:hypothetical protein CAUPRSCDRAFT_10245 [Caulochytrium protostelioides]